MIRDRARSLQLLFLLLEKSMTGLWLEISNTKMMEQREKLTKELLVDRDTPCPQIHKAMERNICSA